MNQQTKPAHADFVISRIYQTSPAILFSAFTDPAHLQHWWGPEGFVVFDAKLDLRPGGSYHFGLRAPSGDEMWGKFVYREISPPDRLVWVHSFADAAGNVVKHSMSQDWPLLMLATVTFVEQAQGTLLTIRFAALDASAAERDVFTANHDSMQQGWTGTLDQLTRYLSKLEGG